MGVEDLSPLVGTTSRVATARMGSSQGRLRSVVLYWENPKYSHYENNV